MGLNPQYSLWAPCEAEAQCAVLCKGGKVFASGSEDMDTLTCGSPVLIRHLTYSEARKMPIMEIHLEKVLSGLGLTMDQFIDLCILLGCDYSEKIIGIGPKRALKHIKKYGSIEKVLKNLDKQKYVIPDPFPYEAIRTYFKNPDAKPAVECDVSFTEPDEEGLVQFLCKEKGFNEDRVRAGIAKIVASKQKSCSSKNNKFFSHPSRRQQKILLDPNPNLLRSPLPKQEQKRLLLLPPRSDHVRHPPKRRRVQRSKRSKFIMTQDSDSKILELLKSWPLLLCL